MGSNEARTRGVAVTAAVAALLGMLAIGPSGAAAVDAGPTDDDAFYDDSVFTDPMGDDFGDPCDPAIHPDWESDPFCNPAATDDPLLFAPEFVSEAPPDTLAFTGDPPPPLDDRSDLVDAAPLTDLGTDEALAVGAHRMLFAIDALAELGAYERSVQPSTGALVRDIRDSIPADGLTEEGYIDELADFVEDFVPFLDALEASGIEVSEELWIAIDDLEFVGLAPGGLSSGSVAFLRPGPWIDGVADLLVRRGATGSPETTVTDAAAIRTVLNEFRADGAPLVTAAEPSEPSPTTTTTTTPPTATVIDEAPVPEAESGFPLPVAGAAVVGSVAAAVALRLRRRSPAASAPSDRPGGSAIGHEGAFDGQGPIGVETASARRTTSPDSNTTAPSVTDLLDASRRMTASLDAASIADIALAEARRLVDAEGGIVVRRSPTGLEPVSCEPPMLFSYDHIPDSCLTRVVETGRSTTSIANDEPLLVEVPMAMAAVPIVADGVVSGAILVVRLSARPFVRDELDSLEMLAPLVGSAFAAADTHETATELADVEPLTGLQNRRRLDLDLASISANEQIAYLMVDIDHFKNFNDTNGHAAGDEAIRRVSALLSASVRPRDLVYRYGGEEFCVLLPGATAREAAEVAERARAAVENANIPGMENQPEGRVTISVGVSDSAWGTPDDLVERADAALYRSKRNGRNQVSLHQH